MFLDIGWTEMLVVAVVLIVVVGPKDLPGMLRAFGRTMKQFRSMAGDFRKQFDEALKEAELDEVRKSVDEVRSLDPRRQMREAMKPMHEIGDDIRSSVRAATKMPADHIEPAKSEPTTAPPLKTSPVEMEPLDKRAGSSETPVPATGRSDAPGGQPDTKPMERNS
ncbi:Sec-independent protein translocase protein TatB [Fulvimarina sp. 2208YS6-2-32]|uniref:Sec-independent protein translocase protein TatB n=1 Tax=Fulvimarina uroteuthidis TaxID=3098149 RepID=A0ABU5I5E8_9HYPH|nr:Sec-independent protein translocase protein TatB [Fulvimarina sp. 2208YS6-2-32]MDY8110602.1 Sec-independent protein translocase protein TatB [Fulvimarina sp. 2208YS6-2-32]